MSTLSLFCGSELWDTALTWTSPDPDFTPCFHKTVLIYAPCLLLWLLTPLEYILNAQSTSRFIPWCWQNKSRVATTSALLVLTTVQLVHVVYLALANEDLLIVGADFVAPGALLSTYALSLVLTLQTRRCGRVNSFAQTVFWLALGITQGLTFGSILVHDDPRISPNVFSDVLRSLCFLLIAAMFVLSCFADRPPDYGEIGKESSGNKSPQKKSSVLNQLMFLWFDSTVWKAKKKVIDKEDVWDLNEEDSVFTVFPEWSRHWSRSSRSLTFTILRQFGLSILVAGCFQLFYDFTQFVNPLILNLFITFIGSKEPIWHGYFYTVGFSIVALVSAIFDSQYWFRVDLVGLRLRSALCSAIYRKSLRLSNKARQAYTAGDIVNLISIDSYKLEQAVFFLAFLWSAPLKVVVATYFLYQQLDAAAFMGIIILTLLVPLNAIVWNLMSKYQDSQMRKKDSRVRLITEVLGGIKVLKMFGWEQAFLERINQTRKEEISLLKVFQYTEGSQFFVWNFVPTLVAVSSFAAYVLIDPVNNVLDPQRAFVSVNLFNLLRAGMFMLPLAIASLIQGAISVKRMGKYLKEEELDHSAITHEPDPSYPLTMSHCSFSWDSPNGTPVLRDINWRVEEGSLVAVVGTVGSGKSSLLASILGEMAHLEGQININAKVAYVPQQAWMQNITLKENILFGRKYYRDIYDKVIDSCALRPDLAILTGGDETEIGEKGINLSGGQKQRISLARAVYSNSSLYLFDDPLSAVDSHVGKHIFNKVMGPSGLLRKKTRILVTHAISFLPEMDKIIVMREGKIEEAGTYEQLVESKGAFAEFLFEQLQVADEDKAGSSGSESDREEILNTLEETFGVQQVQTILQIEKKRMDSKRKRQARLRTKSIGALSDPGGISDSESAYSLATASFLRMDSMAVSKDLRHEFQVGRDLVEDESVETKRVKFSIYLYYAKAMGMVMTLLGILFYGLGQLCMILSNLLLSVWSSDQEAVSDIAKRNVYLISYGLLGLGQALAIFVAIIALTIGTLRASNKLHQELIGHILKSNMAFFDTTPLGRIINRFSKDMDEVDMMIPTHIKDTLTHFFSIIATIVIISYASPTIILIIMPLILIFLYIQISYLEVSRQLKRLVSTSRSPINSSLTESFSGATVIRAYQRQENFILTNDQKIETNQTFYYPEVVSATWLFNRLETLSNLLIISSSLVSVIFRDSLDPGMVGLSLTYALTCQLDLFMIIRYIADLEKSIVSVERIREYQNTPTEAAFHLPELDPAPQWPEQGSVEFKNYETRYRDGLDLVLRGLSFRVNPGEKVGVVGRTGAGKSSLAQAIFRLIEASQGQILIDDLDIAQMGLARLRQALTIIPQDPVLFAGSLRFNLDPHDHKSDAELWTTLGHAHLKDFVKSLPRGLDHVVTGGGENMSVGQRQLVCLARALLRKTKILILDEATAAVDLETDDLIQATIRSEFQDCTILTIAHRLKTILDSDRILLLDAGKVSEFEKPAALLKNTSSVFYSMARDAGLV